MVSWKKKGGLYDYFHGSTLHGADISVTTEVNKRAGWCSGQGERSKKIV